MRAAPPDRTGCARSGTFRAMRLQTADGRTLWLGYGMNVHPGGDARTTIDAIHSTVLPLKERLAVPGPLGLAVRWSASGVGALADETVFAPLHDLLGEHDLHVFTGNAFVHGDFHGRPLKDAVYRPAWSEQARTDYTVAFAEVLAALNEPGASVSLSTSPCAWRGWGGGAQEEEACAEQMADCARRLRRLEEASGVRVRLAIEPEPRCTLETTAELRAFFAGPLEQALAGDADLRTYLGACYDVCHQAVVHEDARESLGALVGDGIAIPKLQASCALELADPSDADGRAALARFDEPVYLHQVGAPDAAGRVHMAEDLGAVLADETGAWRGRAPWRVHFHVPVFRAEATPPLRTTRAELEAALRYVAQEDVTDQIEIETYTWDVLPDAEKAAGSGRDLVEALAREYEWVLGILREEGVTPIS